MEEEKCLTQEEIDDLHLAFDLFLEEKNNNKLNVDKLLENFKLINLHTKHKNIFDFFDNIKNKEITFEEFIKQINKKLNENDNTEILFKIFNLFVNNINNNNENNNSENENENNKNIKIENITKILNDLEDNLSLDEVKDIMKTVAKNGNEITFEEFCDIMTNPEYN
jgi:Ca2+-binding EF-hand superfamily protein